LAKGFNSNSSNGTNEKFWETDSEHSSSDSACHSDYSWKDYQKKKALKKMLKSPNDSIEMMKKHHVEVPAASLNSSAISNSLQIDESSDDHDSADSNPNMIDGMSHSSAMSYYSYYDE